STFDLLVNGKPGLKDEQQPSCVRDDFDASTCTVEWNGNHGKEVVLTFSPQHGASVTLCGFAIDVPDPEKQAIKASPANLDEHAPEDLALTWTSAKSVVTHRLYLGTSKEAVENASPTSPEFKGELTE